MRHAADQLGDGRDVHARGGQRMVSHPVKLRGLVFDGATGAPLAAQRGAPAFIERQDQEFVQAIFGELRSEEGRKALAGTLISDGTLNPQGLKLLQPVHGVFNVALLEACCDVFGEPRVEATRIESAGLVIRRVGAGNTREAWVRRDGKVAGWVTLDGEEQEREPDPGRREGPAGPGPADVRRELLRLMRATSRDQETVTSLFIAPPDACAAAKRTVLYGLLQVASGEAPEGASSTAPAFDDAQVRSLLSPYFAAGKTVDWTGLEGLSVTYQDVAQRRLPQAKHDKLALFIDFLRGLVAVFDAFQVPALMTAMNRVQLDYGNGQKRPAGTALSGLADVLVQGKTGTVVLPRSWTHPNASEAAQVLQAAKAATAPRMRDLIPPERRFERRGSRYVARAFVRIHREDGCPPAIVWSEESAPFTIAAWHERGKRPPVLIPLPSLKDLSAFKPNVTFQVPPGMNELLNKNSPKDFLEGSASTPAGQGIGWLCGFNIPIITLCAFIVLNLFLSLLNIVFFWIALIKICIPIPASLRERFED
ncbi:hypothetical protein MXAN_4502 [Myxococcus xanthus DK 1622]|uniref:Uncharacterized protein n=2 Tax=Myxococcaceae TaxID=31 RepID=Q1D3V2_MYXXD|nr:hypothetical protein MXAN_4502 [Myxococcus xanthus DK 1622]NOJ53169.1 hypothetical protein [Myxococcus xanthus]QPM77077.1 hypothetical protein I5Q59_22280 [Myxococcus xanthus]QVW66145.1 hypothetical protein JTM82_27635 [Myxococcus xanthus DZ2]UEO07727.1 hypothetical protein K1515_15160 [Myxococcus xanthus DZ2]